jgi:hypothetical protein
MTRAVWGLLAAWGCVADVPSEHDTAPVDTGVDAGAVAPEAVGQAPGAVSTAEQPLSTFPLDGSVPYDGPLPSPPADDQRFAVETHLTGAEQDWRLDIGLAAGPGAATLRDVGVRLAFNPTSVRRYQLRGANGRGDGVHVQRIPSLAPGQAVGATFDLWPTSPTDARGAPRRHRSFLGTLTVSWTEDAVYREQIIVLDAPTGAADAR